MGDDIEVLQSLSKLAGSRDSLLLFVDYLLLCRIVCYLLLLGHVQITPKRERVGPTHS